MRSHFLLGKAFYSRLFDLIRRGIATLMQSLRLRRDGGKRFAPVQRIALAKTDGIAALQQGFCMWRAGRIENSADTVARRRKCIRPPAFDFYVLL
jgi:hypothetical protein